MDRYYETKTKNLVKYNTKKEALLSINESLDRAIRNGEILLINYYTKLKEELEKI